MNRIIRKLLTIFENIRNRLKIKNSNQQCANLDFPEHDNSSDLKEVSKSQNKKIHSNNSSALDSFKSFLNLKQFDQVPLGNFRHGYVYAGNETVISETHFGCQLFLNLKNFDVVPAILKTGWWEPWNDKLVRSILNEDDTYVNCGANFGYFTLLGAYCVGHKGTTISIEANPWLFDHLMKSILYSGMKDRTHAFNCAVGHTSGEEMSVMFAPEWAGGGYVNSNEDKKVEEIPLTSESLANFKWPDTLSGKHNKGKGRMYETSHYSSLLSAKVPTLTLSDICEDIASDVRLIHMDIEGAEPGTILGSKELIASCKDLFMIFEWSVHARKDDEKRDALEALNFLMDQGFKFYKITPHGDAYLDFPKLQKMDKDGLMSEGHCDIFCTRQ